MAGPQDSDSGTTDAKIKLSDVGKYLEAVS
jgi:hypothetical protein